MAILSKIWEWVKDLVGVLDDAGDYIDRVKKAMEDVDHVVTQLNKETSDIKKELELIRHSDDLEIINRLFDKLDLDRPLIFGRAIGKKLVDAQKELEKLEQHLSRQDDPLIGQKARPVIRQAMNQLNRVFKEHGDLLAKISQIQMQRRDALRDTMKNAAKYGTLAMGAATISLIGTITTIVAVSGVFRGTVNGFISYLIHNWQETDVFLRHANEGRRRDAEKAADDLAAEQLQRQIAETELRRRGGDAGRDF